MAGGFQGFPAGEGSAQTDPAAPGTTPQVTFSEDGFGGFLEAEPDVPSGGDSGSVTSVALTVPSDLAVSGSPITSSGTLAVTRTTQSANTALLGPSSGSAATPAFRAIVSADLPVGSAAAFGAFKVDGSTVTASAGVLSASGTTGATGAAGPTSLVTPPARFWRAAISPGAPATRLSIVAQNDGQFNGTPVLAVLRNGTLLTAYRDAAPTAAQGTAGKVTIQSSTDGGATWSGKTALATPTGSNDFQPFALRCLVGGPHAGRVLLAYWNFPGTLAGSAISTLYSDDDGATWSSPAALGTQPYTSASVGGGNILEHSTGPLLMPVYGENSGDSSYQAGVLFSTDSGATWGGYVAIAGTNTNYDEMNLIELPNGAITAFVRQESASAGLFTSRSTDVGATWSSLTGIGFSAWGAQPAVALFPVSQILVLFYRHITDQECAWRWSADYGTTWSSETIISTDGWGYGSAVPLTDHQVGVIYAHQYDSNDKADLAFVVLQTGAPGGTITVTDGSTTVDSAATLTVVSGGAVTDGGGGNAELTISGGGGGTLTSHSAALATDVTMTTAATFYDGPSISMAAGTWLVIGHASVLGSTGANDATVRIWDHTTTFAEGQGETAATGQNILLSCSGIMTLVTTTTVYLSCTLDTNASGVNGKLKADPRTGSSGAHKATVLNAIQLA